MKLWLENILRYLLLLILQVLLIDNLQFFGLCHPCVYLLFLLLLPVSLPRWAELLIGFATGFVMDLFCNTLGVHTAACTMVAYLRPLFIRKLVQENERIMGTPNSIVFGMGAYVKMVVLLTVIHHFMVFALATFSLHNWWLTLVQIVLSSAVCIAVFLGYDFLRNRV